MSKCSQRSLKRLTLLRFLQKSEIFWNGSFDRVAFDDRGTYSDDSTVVYPVFSLRRN